MNTPHLLHLIIAFLVGMFIHFIWSKYIWPARHHLYIWIFTLRRNGLLGDICPTDQQFDRKGYNLGYSYQKKAALWVSYAVSKRSLTVDINTSSSFKEDPAIPKKHRTHPSNFTNTGYDKGHLAPSSIVDFSQKSNSETYLMSNIVLQHPKLNRQAWRSLENRVKEWAKTRGKMYVVTGPIYEARPPKINGISLPTAFFKVIYSAKHRKSIGFVLPNRAVSARQLWQYVCKVADVEEKTGYTFLKKLNRRGRKSKFVLDLKWWQGKKKI